MGSAGAIGRLGNVTKLLQRQRIDSQWRMHDFVNGGAFLPFPRSTQGQSSGSITPGNFEISHTAISVEKLPRRRRRKKNATCRRRIILASVVNASSRRRRGVWEERRDGKKGGRGIKLFAPSPQYWRYIDASGACAVTRESHDKSKRTNILSSLNVG